MQEETQKKKEKEEEVEEEECKNYSGGRTVRGRKLQCIRQLLIVGHCLSESRLLLLHHSQSMMTSVATGGGGGSAAESLVCTGRRC